MLRKSLFTLLFATILASWCQAAPVAQIDNFEGVVIVKSGKKIFRLESKGQNLQAGDFVQTRQGTATVKFLDGATLKVRPFSSTRIAESQEKGKKTKRKITCFAGKLWFKSGKKSKVKNFLQTPNMICGLRGTEVEIGSFPKRREVGRITKISGVVIVQSGRKISRISETGHMLFADDRVQTRMGTAEVTFNDGSLLKVRPFSRARIQEKRESDDKVSRRITCLTGKLRLKSGFSKKIKNYVQTPNMICGLRGTEVEFAAVPTRLQIGRISRIDGNVILRSGRQLSQPTEAGAVIFAGDHVQTKQGTAQIVFSDGAVLIVRPFSSILLQEEQQQRRITCFVGKVWFKSGIDAQLQNALQTPNMVCSLDGKSTVEAGHDASKNKSFVNVIAGRVQGKGIVLRGQFANPGEISAMASNVFRNYASALDNKDDISLNNALAATSQDIANNPEVKAIELVRDNVEQVTFSGDSHDHDSYLHFDEGSYDLLDGKPLDGKASEELISQNANNSLAFSGKVDAVNGYQNDAALMSQNPDASVRETAIEERNKKPKNIIVKDPVLVREGNVDFDGNSRVVNSIPESDAANLEQSAVGNMLDMAAQIPEFAAKFSSDIDQVVNSTMAAGALADAGGGLNLISSTSEEEGEGEEADESSLEDLEDGALESDIQTNGSSG